MNRAEQITIMVVIFLGALLIAWLNDFTKPKRAKKNGPNKPGGVQQSPATPWGWLFLVFTIMVLFLYLGPRQAQGPAPARNGSAGGLICLGFFVVAVLFVVITIARAYFRDQDRAVARALRRWNEGDRDGAIAGLQRVIEEKGVSANRANGLGALLSLEGKWEEALAVFRQAEGRGGEKNALNRLNIGISLANLGRGEEAYPFLIEATKLGRQHVVIGCNACRTLAKLGYLDDAREVLRQVDESRKGTIYLASSHRTAVEAEVETCRALVAGKPATSADDLGDEL